MFICPQSVSLCTSVFLLSVFHDFLKNYRIYMCHEASLEKLKSDVQFMALLGLHKNKSILYHFIDTVQRKERKVGESKVVVICVAGAFLGWEWTRELSILINPSTSSAIYEPPGTLQCAFRQSLYELVVTQEFAIPLPQFSK